MRWTRCRLAVLAAAVAVTAVLLPAGVALPASPDARTAVRADQAPAQAVRDGDPWDRSRRPPLVLRDGTAEQAGFVSRHLAALEPALLAGLEPSPDTPRYAGAVALAARNGVVAERVAVGHALRYGDGGEELPADERLPAAEDTIFDLASLSKLFTTIAVLQLVDDGLVGLDDAAAAHLPAFGVRGKDAVTVRQLLTHTSGLPAWRALWAIEGDRDDRLAALYDTELASEPGAVHRYSDLGYIVLGELVAAVAGLPLDRWVHERIAAPLRMTDTTYNPPADLRGRIAATEDQPWTGRGVVHGEAHDENAWALDGVAGHAGLFGTAGDLAVLVQTLLNGGRYGTARILRPETVTLMMTNHVAPLGADRGLGPQLDEPFYMDALSSPVTAGHTGFTGTSIVVDPVTDAFLVLLTNRVHPSRAWASVNPARQETARAVARAMAVRPAVGSQAWFSGIGGDRAGVLDVPLELPDGGRLEAALWYHLLPGDALAVEVSHDGGESWAPAPVRLAAAGRDAETVDGEVAGWGERRWWDARVDLAGARGPVTVRFRSTAVSPYSGRGVYVDALRARDADGDVVFTDANPHDHARVAADGWERSSD